MTDRPDRRSWVVSWLLLIVLVAVLSIGFELLGLPSPLLFAALIGGLVHALTWSPTPELPRGSMTVGQAIIGVTVGASVDFAALRTLGSDWPVIVAVSAATIVVSLLAGMLLRLHRGVSATTAAFASVAGGASGIVAMSRELGADDRVVTVIQYLRVLVILLAMPAVVSWAFKPESTDASVAAPSGDMVTGVAYSVLAILLGLALGRLLRLPSPAILGSLIASIALAYVPVFDGVVVPGWVMNVGFILIGVQVGLRFTPASIKAIGRMLPTALLVITLIIVASAGLGVLLAYATGVSQLDAYLATTPGGLYAVLAISTATDGNVTFVTSVQILRLLMVIALAPLIARWLVGRRPPAAS